MYNFTIPMALMDFVPVIFFGVTAVVLLRDLYSKMVKGAYALPYPLASFSQRHWLQFPDPLPADGLLP